MTEIKTYEFDIVTEYITLDKSIQNLHARIPSAVVILKTFEGPSGGWPVIHVEITEDQSAELKAWYYEGIDNIDDYDIADHEVITS